MNTIKKRIEAERIIDEYKRICESLDDDMTYGAYVEMNNIGPSVITVLQAKDMIKFCDEAEKLTAEEIARITAIPSYKDDMREVKDIKDAHGFSWSEMKLLRGGLSTKLSVKDMRELLGESRQKFSDRYHIPTRTIEDWESGKRTPAPYVVELLQRAVLEDLKMSK